MATSSRGKPDSPLKRAERALRRLRGSAVRFLRTRRARALAARTDLAALARRADALARPEAVAVCVDASPDAARACRRCLDALLAQALPCVHVTLLAPRAVLRHLDGPDRVGAHDRTTFLDLDAAGGSVVRGLGDVLAAHRGVPIMVLDAAAVPCDDAVLWIASTWARHPAPRAFYADHLEVAGDDAAVDVARDAGPPRLHLKPRFSSIHLLSRDIVAPLVVYDRGLLAAAVERLAAEPRPSTCPGALYAVALEALGGLTLVDVAHVAEPLASLPLRAAADERAVAADRAAVAAAALARRGIDAVVRPLEACPAVHDVAPRATQTPRVSIIIPTKNGADLVTTCVESARAQAGYDAYDVTVIDHASDEPALLDYLARESAAARLRVFPYAGPFNFAAMNNAAVKATEGSWLLFLNNDVSDFSPGWLADLVAVTELDPRIAAVGVRLRYPDGDLQHGGAILDRKRMCLHLHRGRPADDPGYLGRVASLQEFSAVTAACVLVRRSAFVQLGGFDERFPNDYNDIDLCLRLRRAGWKVVYTPRVRAVHWESRTRRVGGTARDLFVSRWAPSLARDDFFHPYLSPTEFVPDGLARVWRERKRVALAALVAGPLPRPAPAMTATPSPLRGTGGERRAA